MARAMPAEAEPEPEASAAPGDLTDGYVLWQAPERYERWLGLHRVTWTRLERRLGVPAGRLAVTLGEHGLHIRRVRSLAEAEHHWARGHHDYVMPHL